MELTEGSGLPNEGTLLAHGLGRSYGDSCLVGGGTLLRTKRLDHFRDFCLDKGLLEVEAGISLDTILRHTVPHGWFLPVTPGTRFVSVGGAIANDVHGKNHHIAGTFGSHVLWFDLLRSDGATRRCSPVENPGLYRATIGGLGLTGVILRAAIQLVRIPGPWIRSESLPFGDLAEFAAISAESADWPYTVAWFDCSSPSGTTMGIFLRGDFSEGPQISWREPRLAVPRWTPGGLVNRPTVALFNKVYRMAGLIPPRSRLVPFIPFFYPLDAVSNWNRLYGPRGFLQWQCVIPEAAGMEPLKLVIDMIHRSGQGSPLAVLKIFGNIASPGMLSFPLAGTTLALDFPIRGKHTFELLERLDRIVAEAAGRIYAAKDARMSAQMFARSYPGLAEFDPYRDPRFTSAFWERVSR